MTPHARPPGSTLTAAAVLYMFVTSLLPLLALRYLDRPWPPFQLALILLAPALGLVLVLACLLRSWRALASLASVWCSCAAILGLILPFALSVPLADRLFADPRVVYQFTPTGAVLGVALVLFMFCGLHVAAGLSLYAWACSRAEVHPRHLCRHCGYDLRATPDPDGPLLARCPECGRPREAR